MFFLIIVVRYYAFKSQELTDPAEINSNFAYINIITLFQLNTKF